MVERVGRVGGVVIAVAGAALLLRVLGPQPALLVALAREPQQSVDAHGADVVALALCGVLAWLVLGWLTLGLALTAAGRLPGAVGVTCRALADVALPAVLRRTMALTLGVSLVAGAGAATAAAAAPVPVSGRASTSQLAGGHAATGRPPTGQHADRSADLDWPTTPSPHRAQPDHSTPGHPVVVLRGDTLWSIAAAALPAGASDAEIAALWPHWYAANRHVIGADPGLIRPGQILHAPTPRRTR